MIRAVIVSIGICFGIATTLPALAADNTPLNVKAGLWEVTSDGSQSGAPPIPPEALARLSPEQRAQFEAAMRQSAGPHHQVSKRCVTQADIAKSFEKMGQMDGGRCTQNVSSSTATLRAGTFSCTGRENASGTYRIEARSRESVIANWNATISNGGKEMKITNTAQGKWLSADCGSVKPDADN